MSKTAIRSPGAPGAIGPYSQAIALNGLVFLSGQIGIDPDTGKVVGGGTGAEAERALQNLQAVLEAASLSFDDVVRTTIYLADLSDFLAVNEIYGRFFTAPFPARSTVGVAALPLGARVEIDAIAVAG